MKGMTTALTRARGVDGSSRSWVRIVCGLLAVAILVPMLLTAMSGQAFAKDCTSEDEECENYSLYQLASKASTYFNNANSPDGDKIDGRFNDVLSNSSSAGSMIGFADESTGFMGWLFSGVSGSTQTVEYSAFKNSTNPDKVSQQGLTDYAHFGAANADLGFDTMSTNVIDEMIHGVAGFLMLIFYALAIAVGWLFTAVIKILKFLNPFSWFYYAVEAVSPTFAKGMTQGGDVPGAFEGLAQTISGWYGLLIDISLNVIVPIFLGVVLIGIFLFKKMNRGAAWKKLAVRVVFIVVGLPLLGSMYTQVLDKMDTGDGQSSGASRVVLSTYVDFDSWAMKERLALPESAIVEWDGSSNQASSQAQMAVRNSALAINANSNSAFSGLGPTVTGNNGTAEGSWKDSQPDFDICEDDEDGCKSDSDSEVFAVVGLLGRYMSTDQVEPSDFESGVKNSITGSGVDSKKAKNWFTDNDGYDDGEEDFGEEHGDGEAVKNHPLFVTEGDSGLTSSREGSTTTFTTNGVSGKACGTRVSTKDGKPLACNLSPLSTYNYLNTGFDKSSMTMYSSTKATSGFTRETHDSVTQVGTGVASFMYWFNAIILLVCVVVLGVFYALGMLVSSFKRTFGVVTAIPFATLGALAGISKVIIYSIALILEVIGTLFLYNFVSEVLISLPGIIEGPVSGLMKWGPFAASSVLGGLVVIIMTLISTLLIIVATLAMLRVRGSVLKAINEAVTKLVDKFLETNTAPPSSGGGMAPAMAGGLGAGAGMALGNRMMNGGGKTPRPGSGSGGGGSTSTQGSTNTGGMNPDMNAIGQGSSKGQLGPGSAGGLSGALGQGPDGQGPEGGEAIDSSESSSQIEGTKTAGQLESGQTTGQPGSGQAAGQLSSGQTRASSEAGGNGGHGEGGVDGADGQSKDGKDGGNSLKAGEGDPSTKGGSMKSSNGQNGGRRDQEVANSLKEKGGLSGSTPDALVERRGGSVSTQGADSNLGGVNGPQRPQLQKSGSQTSGQQRIGESGSATGGQASGQGRKKGQTSNRPAANTPSGQAGNGQAPTKSGSGQRFQPSVPAQQGGQQKNSAVRQGSGHGSTPAPRQSQGSAPAPAVKQPRANGQSQAGSGPASRQPSTPAPKQGGTRPAPRQGQGSVPTPAPKQGNSRPASRQPAAPASAPKQGGSASAPQVPSPQQSKPQPQPRQTNRSTSAPTPPPVQPMTGKGESTRKNKKGDNNNPKH